LATTCLASITGAVALCRATRSIDPLFQVAEELRALLFSRSLLARLTPDGAIA
jgi:hypothetical protein